MKHRNQTRVDMPLWIYMAMLTCGLIFITVLVIMIGVNSA